MVRKLQRSPVEVETLACERETTLTLDELLSCTSVFPTAVLSHPPSVGKCADTPAGSSSLRHEALSLTQKGKPPYPSLELAQRKKRSRESPEDHKH